MLNTHLYVLYIFPKFYNFLISKFFILNSKYFGLAIFPHEFPFTCKGTRGNLTRDSSAVGEIAESQESSNIVCYRLG